MNGLQALNKRAIEHLARGVSPMNHEELRERMLVLTAETRAGFSKVKREMGLIKSQPDYKGDAARLIAATQNILASLRKAEGPFWPDVQQAFRAADTWGFAYDPSFAPANRAWLYVSD